MKSWLPPGGGNLFQEIKRVCQEAEASGQTLYRLSIGQPAGPALESACLKAAECVQSKEERWHEYQDNTCVPIPDFARRFAQAHVIRTDLAGLGDQIDTMPIPGIKPMLGLVQLACLGPERHIHIKGMTAPGYPVPETQAKYQGLPYRPFGTGPSNSFLPEFERAYSFTVNREIKELAMLNLPHNPSGQIATREYWLKVCAYCAKHDIRLFNDGAYLALAHDIDCCALADVAPEFPELSWLEAYSASKSIANGTGWRVGAVVVSPDFVGDLRTIKGNTDSGFFAPAAAGALHALETDQDGVLYSCDVYGTRLKMLISWLKERGLKLAVEPGAGFFTLWEAPKSAFGRCLENARDFNLTMIKEAGIVGVHFDPYIRYAVCGPIEEWVDQIQDAFNRANVSY